MAKQLWQDFILYHQKDKTHVLQYPWFPDIKCQKKKKKIQF